MNIKTVFIFVLVVICQRIECGRRQPTPEEICSKPMREGHGSESIARFYYNSLENKCLPFTFRGRGGNKNRFRTEDECQRVCMSNENN
uniref:BPTI/Kunitz inhibitor domain-containing protein n=1 Tax=Schistosoma mansoni TaxID=6183 RepID=A0A5K4FAQ5_SCHMA